MLKNKQQFYRTNGLGRLTEQVGVFADLVGTKDDIEVI